MAISSLNSSSMNSASYGSASRISGLASGLDTESLVEAMTATTRSKIALATQQKQILEWKQEDYRSILSNLVEFNSKYFGSSYSSLTIVNSIKNLTAVSSNTSYVTAIAGDGASSGSVYISDIQSLASAAKIQGTALVSPELSFAVDTGNLNQLAGSAFNLTLDGTTKTITFTEGDYSSAADVASALSALIDDAFGAGRINVSAAAGRLSLTAENSVISIADPGGEGAQALAILGFANTDTASNRLDLSKTLGDYASVFGGDTAFIFSINGKAFSFDSDASLNRVISTINASDANVKIAYSKVSDTFTITSKETGSGSGVKLQDTDGAFLATIFSGGIVTAGKDAVVKLSMDGSTDPDSMITVTRSSNTFALEGITYTLKGMAANGGEEAVSVNTALNIEAAVDKIVGFVDAYNQLLGSITSKLYEERDKDYQPLTEEQQEDLSDTEIEKWNSKSRIGWLRNDTYLSQIGNSLRTSLYKEITKTDGSGESLRYILADIGITTGDYTKEGQLVIDQDKLRASLAKDPESIIALLTQQSTVGYSLYNTQEAAQQRYNESGLLWRINDIIKTNINAVGEKKGSLVRLVGNPKTGYIGDSTYKTRLNDVQEMIKKLNTKLKNEEERYWARFTAMESSISSLSAQASWLTSQFSS